MAKGSFQRKAESIEAGYVKKGLSVQAAKKRAYGGLANAARGASSKAKAKNPNLKKVKGK